MSRSTPKQPPQPLEDPIDKQIQDNVAKWQSSDDPLAPLNDEQLDLIYEIGDVVNSLYFDNEPQEQIKVDKQELVINNNKDFIQWMINVEKEIQHENLKNFQAYFESLTRHLTNCESLFKHSEATVDSVGDLRETYKNVIDKTNYLHHLSEQLMVQQRVLKEKKHDINSKLKYFVYFSKCQESVEYLGHCKVNNEEFIDVLNNIDNAIDYLGNNLNFKESKVYKMKYESLLTTALTYVYNYINEIICETTKQLISSENIQKNPDTTSESIFSLYYGKFQSASVKVKLILDYIEVKDDLNSYYQNTLYDCQKSYFTQRQPILEVATSKALSELKEKHKNDYSTLFRACCLFTIKVCIDEARCYNYFFKAISNQLHDYLASLCQYLYDTLRPCLILINYIETLSELCSILKNEMLSEKVLQDPHLTKYIDVIKQLLEDVEERLVFRTNVFFKRDLNDYKPSPGDLAYPEKLLQMENIVVELRERRPDSRASIVSLESQEVANINHPTHLRSYTGNSPADLHGMWYPTVKRTLVCLSRLYFCLDKDTFQGLAQEALIVCVRTVQNAADLISARKTPIDGKLFQIKHLLIIREQIAPFQVDFTTRELSLDFSTVQKAAVELLHHRNQIFSFNSNNALLEFLLDGTPKVKEYLVDSRKEIDKQLKYCCESFIAYVTKLLIGNAMDWIEKAEKILKIIRVENTMTVQNNELTVKGQIYGKPENVAALLKEAQRNMKTRIPEVQRSMQLYLANRETEFILFRPIKNNIINAFMQIDQVLLKGGYTTDDQLQIACPSPEQVNILICSVSLTIEQEPLSS
ncbi:unnamed protein product [Ceutorhynchus assimilis]|uniref:Conserved oligomeric Golgi complex subunit 3 n=1 Tax=Ceutorhynchus assimilis TaxID=467358 RepID=A0A9N9QND4_9CUCU|nr:unnamed protein product [Ceutorhynchus assimilis]